MKNRVNIKKVSFLILVLISAFLVFLLPTEAFALNILQKNDDGYFKKLHSDFPVVGDPVKLKDGRVLITCSNFSKNPYNTLFDPKTNTFRKIAPFDTNFRIAQGILLNTGKVFFVGGVGTPHTKLWLDIDRAVGKEKAYSEKEYRKYAKLPEDEKKEIYLPVIQKNPELLKKYNDFWEAVERSKHAQLYNPETERFELAGKTAFIRAYHPKMATLKDGRVLISDSNGTKVEIYDPLTGKYEIIKDAPPLSANFITLLALNDGRVIFIGKQYTIYDPIEDTYTEPKQFAEGWQYVLKLNDGRLLIFTGKNSEFNTYKLSKPAIEGTKAQAYIYTWQQYNAMWMKFYDPTKDEFSYAGHLAIPRGNSMTLGNTYYGATVLKDGRVLITGGEKDIEKRRLGDPPKLMKEAEIYDPKTRESKLISNMNYKRYGGKEVLLNDGRVLIYKFGDGAELYVPRGYKKKISE